MTVPLEREKIDPGINRSVVKDQHQSAEFTPEPSISHSRSSIDRFQSVSEESFQSIDDDSVDPYITTTDENHDSYNVCPRCEWIIDIHFQKHITHIWTKQPDGTTKHYPIFYHPKIYITGSKLRDSRPPSLEEIAGKLSAYQNIISIKFVTVYESSSSLEHTPGLELQLLSFSVLKKTVEWLQLKNYEVSNIDINPRQQFFLDTYSFPIGKCHIEMREGGYSKMGYKERNSYDYIQEYEIPSINSYEYTTHFAKFVSFGHFLIDRKFILSSTNSYHLYIYNGLTVNSSAVLSTKIDCAPNCLTFVITPLLDTYSL